MRKTKEEYQEQADRAIIKILSDAGPEGMNSSDLLLAAMEIPAEPTRMHRFGDTLLNFVGKGPKTKRRYLPNAAAYRRLREQGVIVSTDQEAADSTDGVSHVINRLAKPPQE